MTMDIPIGFNKKFVKIVVLAQEEARRLGHTFIGTEDLLLGILAAESYIAYDLLHNEGITLEAARALVEEITGRGSDFVDGQLPFTPRAKNVLQQSIDEEENGNEDIQIANLLLALFREKNIFNIMVKLTDNMGNLYVGLKLLTTLNFDSREVNVDSNDEDEGE